MITLGAPCLQGTVDAVVTEDSDLVAYNTGRVFLKMDKFGSGQLICRSVSEQLPIAPQSVIRHWTDQLWHLEDFDN